MKYIEQTKSFLLAFLVLLSITLTLLIWNYKPDYELIDETQIEEILIGETKELKNVLKPYRLLFRQDDQFYGTISPNALKTVYSHLTNLQTTEVDIINSNLSNAKMNEMLRMNNRLTLFFNEEIPLQVFSNIVSINDRELPETGFTRLIIDWSDTELTDRLQLLFLNTEDRILLRTHAEIPNPDRFMAEVIEPATSYSPYVEVERDTLRSLYVAQNPIESTQYTYFIETTSPDVFKSVLFSDPTIVQRNIESAQAEKYTDGTSLMTVDTQNRVLNYVYPPAESIAPIPSAQLLVDSFDFINDHGGFKGDFRLSTMNIDKHVIEYQLFLQGYPIYSNMTSTRIVTTWGENRIFRYRRPYYTIEFDNTDISSVRAVKQLMSGTEVIEHLQNDEDLKFEDIDEIVVGYYLTRDQEKDIFLLEPSWFFISNNDWTHISPEFLGGTNYGLE